MTGFGDRDKRTDNSGTSVRETRTYKIRQRRKGNKKVITKKGKRDGQEKHSDLSRT